MSEKLSPNPEPRGLDKRAGNSRKLLSRKARERAPIASEASLESCFPPAELGKPPLVDPKPQASDSEPFDPVAFSSVTSPKSGKADLKLRPGDIAPNPGTIVAAVVRLVVERGELTRLELIALMSDASLAHPKARPAEKGWSQGYVAGAIRSGFLAVAVKASPAAPGQPPCQER